MRILFVITAFILPFVASTQRAPDSNWVKRYVSQFSSDTGGYLPEIKLIDEKGNKRTLADFKGKIVYINVWNKRCAASIDMFPYEAQLMKRLRSVHLDTCVQIIDICSGASERKWKRALAKYKPRAINLLLKGRKKWHIKSWPMYILLDTNGKVVGRHISNPQEGTIDYILYAATKGISPVQAVWMELTGGKFNGINTTDEKELVEYRAWQKSLAPAKNEFFRWRREHEQQDSH